jgi:hypothetical protein
MLILDRWWVNREPHVWSRKEKGGGGGHLPSWLREGVHLPPQGILIGRVSAGISSNLLLCLEHKSRAITASQTNESAHLATLLFQRCVRSPVDRARVLSRPGGGGALVVEVGERLELSICEKPKLQHGAREVRMNGASCELDERREGQSHLM